MRASTSRDLPCFRMTNSYAEMSWRVRFLSRKLGGVMRPHEWLWDLKSLGLFAREGSSPFPSTS